MKKLKMTIPIQKKDNKLCAVTKGCCQCRVNGSTEQL